MDAAKRLMDKIAAAPGEAEAISRPLAQVELKAPVPRPNSIRDCLVFEEHLINAMQTVAKGIFPPAAWVNAFLRKSLGVSFLKPPRSWYKMPIYYKGNPDTVIGPGETVLWPSYTEKLDYELEFGLFILAQGKDVPEKDAAGLIAGFTVFNDFSARDIQLEEMTARLGPAKGKDFDTGNAMGPWLVTPDEISDPYSLKMEAFVNGERWSDNVSSGMRFSFAEIIAYISRSETLKPCDFIGSGTVGGGCGLELDRWLRPGDTVTLKVEKIGELENPIVRS
jgi:2-keto-4-pentenoate hydratase/2-oxohepta-3-ene-1,7-dioic acid hydratase in catechol pathway